MPRSLSLSLSLSLALAILNQASWRTRQGKVIYLPQIELCTGRADGAPRIAHLGIAEIPKQDPRNRERGREEEEALSEDISSA